MAEQTKRQQLEQYLAAVALRDPEFRERLLESPKATIEEEIGLRFPATLEIKVHEDKLNELHIVLPVDIETVGEIPQIEESEKISPWPFWWKTSQHRRA